MAKKPTKKPTKKPAKKPTKATKKPAPKSPAKASRTPGPKPISSGPGATPREIGSAVVAHVNAGKPDEALWAKFWHKDCESIEGHGQIWKGLKAIEGKSAWWRSMFTVHGVLAEGPFLGATGFAIRFRVDAEEKATGKRSTMNEVGVYTVKNGKVVREEFMGQAE